MDFNGDHLCKEKPDKELAEFIVRAGLLDPFYEKHGFSPQTYIRGPRGIDKALIDRGSYPALRAIGHLATHDGAFSDHVVGFMDWDAQLFSQGLINRPP